MKADASACSGPSKTYNGIRVKEKWTKLRPSAKKTKLELVHVIRSIVQLPVQGENRPSELHVCLSVPTTEPSSLCLSVATFTHALQQSCLIMANINTVILVKTEITII